MKFLPYGGGGGGQIQYFAKVVQNIQFDNTPAPRVELKSYKIMYSVVPPSMPSMEGR
jgi:hypothetical protein